MSKEEKNYGMEVLPQRRSRWEEDEELYGMEVLHQKKNPTAWKSYLKGGTDE